jgi:hypothetical protein
VANQGQTVFPYTFRIFAAADLVVERLRNNTTTTLQLTVDYTVSGVGNNTGGNVTLTQGAEAGDIIAIVSNQPNQRSTDFTESGDFRAAALNAEFDRIWIAVQQVSQDVSRQITRPLSDPTASYVLPPAGVRANKYLAFAADGSLAYPVAQPAGPNAAEAYWWGGTAGGTANALTIAVGGGPGSYAAGQRYAFIVASDNTGAATLAVNGLGVKSIRRPDGSTLAAGDLVAGTLVGVTYDGVNFRLTDSVTTFGGDLTVAKANPALILDKAASGQAARVFGRTSNANRWAVELGDATAEGGGNAGSDFVIRRYDNGGAVLGAPVIITRASGAVTLEAPLTLPASNPTNANHATRKAYVDAGDIWTKLADQAISNVTTIDVTGFSLQDYRQITVMLLGARVSSSSSTNILGRVFRNGSVVNTAYTYRRETVTSSLSVTTNSNTSELFLTSGGVNTEYVASIVDLVQSEENGKIIVFARTVHADSSNNIVSYRAGGYQETGSGWVNGFRIIAPTAFQANVGRVVVMGLKP